MFGLFEGKKAGKTGIKLEKPSDNSSEKQVASKTSNTIIDPAEEYRRYEDITYLSRVKNIQWKIIVWLVVIMLCQMSFFVFFIKDYSTVRVIPLTQDFRVVPVPILREPMVSDDGLIEWAQRTLTETFSFSFYDWKEVFAKNQSYFSQKAFQAFTSGIDGTLKEIEATRGSVISIALSRPRIIGHGVSNSGRYAWRVQMPVRLSIESAKNRAEEDLLITCIIGRVNPLQSPSGILIENMTISPM